MDQIRQLRTDGLSLADVAERAGVTVAVVRRIVGKLDQAARRREQERVAHEINAESIPWREKAAKWREKTGQSEATLWRVLQRVNR